MARRPKRAHPYFWTSVAAVLAAVWVANGWLSVAVERVNSQGQGRTVFLAWGALGLARYQVRTGLSGPPVRWHTHHEWSPFNGAEWNWLPEYDVGPSLVSSGVRALFPLWPAVLAAGFFAGVHWRRARRGIAGLCPYCNYSRAGLAADVPRPECGGSGGTQRPVAADR